jgi:hypothetical protein
MDTPATDKKPLGDKKTIGITRANEKSLAKLVLAGSFGSELDAAKFAMAHAINTGVLAGTTDSTNTKWNIGTVDASGSLRALIDAMYADVSEPYRLIEHLINEGLTLLDTGDSEPPDVIGLLPIPAKGGHVAEAEDGATV